MYINTILTAVMFFPVVALFITIPYMIHQYHKYGSLPILRILIVYSFVLYLLVAYFLVILPLPDIEVVRNMTAPRLQLMPFRFIVDIYNNAPRNINFIKAPTVYQVLYNLLLTFPFGVYMRYYFKKDLKKTILYTFYLSLFFELTQLSGLYFMYPRSYRLFDVDDLMINTLGGMFGYSMTKIFTFFLPTRDKIDTISYTKGMKVSFVKRSISYMIDIITIFLIFLPINVLFIIFNNDIPIIHRFLLVLIIYFISSPMFTKGYTLGKKTVNMKLARIDNTNCKWYQYILRYVLLYLVLIGFPYLTSYLFIFISNRFSINGVIVIFTIYFFILFLYFIFIVINNIFLNKPFLYEKISNTYNISTIVVPDNDIEKMEEEPKKKKQSKKVKKTNKKQVDNIKIDMI